ncbi:ABC transporter ATP-binding protein [Rhizobium lusitanum]|uniref:ABC transporter ATP-binding protein n=1 Tax=Rhizobium lusitanum TaxID=293958 RepID=UPI001574CD42|nr:ABC transporter ATP-binding protein [Rhizobium lusitanum]NTJ11802.1 ABC transporter ATP-binding protein [Rhizobium lusitanum]
MNMILKTGNVAALAARDKGIQVRNITKTYADHVAVDDVSFDLKSGELLTLLGPSGSGKSTTLMMVAGFENPDRGTINVNGSNIVGVDARKRHFGIVFQGYALFPHMTAMENVEFPLRMRRVAPAERLRLAREMLERVGLGSMTHRRPRELSGGQQQRVALARALVFQPHALLLDEPLGALDKNMREKMQYEIKELQRTLGISILFVTHDQEEAMTMSDRIAVMDQGRILQIGSPKSVYEQPNTAFVANFLGETNMISCHVSGVDAERAVVALGDGQRGAAVVSGSGTALSRDIAARLSVRPENVTILRPGDAVDFRLRGTVKQHTFVGRHSRTIITAGEMDFAVITADAARAAKIAMGDIVDFGWKSEHALVITK